MREVFSVRAEGSPCGLGPREPQLHFMLIHSDRMRPRRFPWLSQKISVRRQLELWGGDNKKLWGEGLGFGRDGGRQTAFLYGVDLDFGLRSLFLVAGPVGRWETRASSAFSTFPQGVLPFFFGPFFFVEMWRFP